MHRKIADDALQPGDWGCSFIAGDGQATGAAAFCDAPRLPSSSYCLRHHAQCHLPPASAGGRLRRREFEAVATAAGGRLGRDEPVPPDAVLRRFTRLARVFLRLQSSWIVLEEEEIMAKTSKARLGDAQQNDDGPTPERLRHGAVERLARAVPD